MYIEWQIKIFAHTLQLKSTNANEHAQVLHRTIWWARCAGRPANQLSCRGLIRVGPVIRVPVRVA